MVTDLPARPSPSLRNIRNWKGTLGPPFHSLFRRRQIRRPVFLHCLRPVTLPPSVLNRSLALGISGTHPLRTNLHDRPVFCAAAPCRCECGMRHVWTASTTTCLCKVQRREAILSSILIAPRVQFLPTYGVRLAGILAIARPVAT